LRVGRRTDEKQGSEEYASEHDTVIQTPARSAGIILHLGLDRAFTPRAGKSGFSRISEFVLPDTIAVNGFESSFRSSFRARINSNRRPPARQPGVLSFTRRKFALQLYSQG
jgi:hypothetical protein